MGIGTHFHLGDNLKHGIAYLWKEWPAGDKILRHVVSPHRRSSDITQSSGG